MIILNDKTPELFIILSFSKFLIFENLEYSKKKYIQIDFQNKNVSFTEKVNIRIKTVIISL